MAGFRVRLSASGRGLPLVAAAVFCACASDPLTTSYPLTAGVIAAMDQGRPFELRISARQRWLACPPSDSNGFLPGAVCAGDQSSVDLHLASVSPEIAAALRQPTTDAMWAAALLDLWSGRHDPRRLDRAIARLREVGARTGTPAAAVNHLAIAHVVRSSVRRDARDLFAALDAAEHAYALDRDAAEIGFNRAVLLSYARADRQAATMWQGRQEPRRSWQREVAARRAAAESRQQHPQQQHDWTPASVNADPQGAREFVLDSLVARWVEASQTGDSARRERVLGDVHTIGQHLASTRGDSSIAHIGRDLLAAAATVPAVARMVAGSREYALARFSSAGAHLSAAVAELKARGLASLSDWASTTRGGVLMAEGNFAEATREFQRVENSARLRNDRALLARAAWGHGIALGRARSMDAAERMIVQARDVFQTLGEGRNVATLEATLTEVYGFLGRSADAAGAAYRAFSSGTTLRYEDHLAFARRLAGDGWARAAVVQWNEGALAAAQSPREKDLPEALARLAEGLSAVGMPDSARHAIVAAKERASRVTDVEMRQRLDAELHRASARLDMEHDPVRARASVDSSIRYFRRIPAELADLMAFRSRLSLAVGDSSAAQRDLDTAVALIRDLNTSTVLASQRQSLEVLAGAQRSLIALTLARGDTAAAWTRTLALTHAPGSDSVSSARVLPGGTAEIWYVVLPSHLLVWLRTAGSRRVAAVPIRREVLAAQGERFVNLMRMGDDTAAIRSLGRSLYDHLLGPHQQALRDVTRIDIIADDLVHGIPLAMLVGEDGRFLVERVSTRLVAPGAVARAAPGNFAGVGHLLVSDPAWERTMFPDLEPLRWASGEIAAIDSLYRDATVLAGPSVTKPAFVNALRSSAVVHFAGHARVATGHEGASFLVLASSGGGFQNNVLYASEVSALDLRQLRLVVLSACGSSDPTRTGAHQPNALAQAFLDAGTQSVVASRWEVDDRETAVLMRALHRALAAGLAADGALRQAQVEGLRRGALSTVAAFTVHVISDVGEHQAGPTS